MLKYKVSLDSYEAGVYIASVESEKPHEQVLLRNISGTLEETVTAIGVAIKKHAKNPWNELR